MFKRIYSLTNIRIWIKPKTHKKSVYFGRACLNLFWTGGKIKKPMRANYVFTNKQGIKITLDLPLTALYKIMKVAQEEGWERHYNKTSCKAIDWRKHEVLSKRQFLK